jgi:predicted HD superfamily hydrolase involved in NAD metabolism
MRERVLTWLADHVPEKRLRHILRVEEMAIALAHHHHLNADQAAQAGLMHDLAKFFPPERLLSMAQAEGLVLDPVDRADPRLLHADVGAIIARDEFGVGDVEVLDAIRNHTLGQPGMSALSCIIYLADALEPGRGNTLKLQELRQLSQQELATATWRTIDDSLKYLLNSRHLIHPRTILTRNWFMQAAAHPETALKPRSLQFS